MVLYSLEGRLKAGWGLVGLAGTAEILLQYGVHLVGYGRKGVSLYTHRRTVWEAVGHDNPVNGNLEKVHNMERSVIPKFDCNVMFARRNLTISKHLANRRQHLDRKWNIKDNTT